MRKEKGFCYYCGRKAITRQHIPGRIFFPKEKRVNLITVPSCNKHNYEKRFLEERMMLYLLGGSGTRLANRFFENKIKRTLMRPENRGLREYLVKNFDIDGNKDMEVLQGDFNNFIILLVSGLYFVHTGIVAFGHIDYSTNKFRGERIRHFIKRVGLTRLVWRKRLNVGSTTNRQVFSYKYLIESDYSCWLIRFYKTVKFLAVINNRKIYKKDI